MWKWKIFANLQRRNVELFTENSLSCEIWGLYDGIYLDLDSSIYLDLDSSFPKTSVTTNLHCVVSQELWILSSALAWIAASCYVIIITCDCHRRYLNPSFMITFQYLSLVLLIYFSILTFLRASILVVEGLHFWPTFRYSSVSPWMAPESCYSSLHIALEWICRIDSFSAQKIMTYIVTDGKLTMSFLLICCQDFD